MMSNDNDAEVIEVDPSPEEEAPAAPTSPSPSKQSNIVMTRTESGRVATDIGKFHLEVEAKQIPLVGFFLASFIFMIAAIAQRRALDNWYGYAVAIGVIGMAVALVGLVLLKYKAEIDQKYIAYGMVVWSVLGACFMTFRNGPFNSTGNGTYDGYRCRLLARLHCILHSELIYFPHHSASRFVALRVLCGLGHGHLCGATLRSHPTCERGRSELEFLGRPWLGSNHHDHCHFLRCLRRPFPWKCHLYRSLVVLYGAVGCRCHVCRTQGGP